MKPKAVVKLAVDVAMTVLLLLLMAFELVGRAAYEWIGVGCSLLSCSTTSSTGGGQSVSSRESTPLIGCRKQRWQRWFSWP